MSGTTSRISSPVAIGCKLPGGLTLRLPDRPDAEFTLNGANASRVIGGYGITTIPSDFWEAWKKAYAGFPPLAKGLIFEQATVAKAEDAAAERAGLKSGLEPLNPQTPAPGISPV